MRVGVLGGTFDPVHNGHLALAVAAREELALDEVLFVPAGLPWRKAGREIASDDDRLAMLRLAIADEPAYRISTIELEREGPSYTADTLEALRAEHPDDELFFLMGEDALADLPNWARPERIVGQATLAVARRSGGDGDGASDVERVVWLKMPLVPVSATDIRERVRRGEPIDDLVATAVAAYIRERGLYRGGRQG